MIFGRHAITRGVIDREETLTQTIEKLSDPKVEIEIRRVVNLITKYLVNFDYEGGLEDSKISQRKVNQSYRKMHREFKFRSIEQYNKYHEGTGYQRRMLGCPSTVSIVHDIISTPLSDINGDRSFYALDLGSGSGILQVAYYIQALRSGLVPSIDTSVGIEVDGNAQKISDKILKTLGVGKTVHGSSLDKSSYCGINGDFFHSVGNENITHSMWRIGSEPFIENLRMLQGLYGVFPGNTQFTPHKLGLIVHKDARSGKKNDLTNTSERIYFNGDISNFLAEIDKRIEISKEVGSNLKPGELFSPINIRITPGSKESYIQTLGHHLVGKYFSRSFYSDFPINKNTRWMYDSRGEAMYYSGGNSK